MKSIVKKITILILLITIICLQGTTYAMGDIISQGEGFIEAADDSDPPINEVQLKKSSDYIYNTLLTIAIVLAVAIGMIIGIQFMVGSVEEQAKIKETLIPYAVGVFVIFGSFAIWKIVINIGNSL